MTAAIKKEINFGVTVYNRAQHFALIVVHGQVSIYRFFVNRCCFKVYLCRFFFFLCISLAILKLLS